MNITPTEFLVIRDRLKFLLSGFSDFKKIFIGKKYEEHIFKFHITAKNPFFKTTADLFCKEIKALLEEIDEKKAGIFSNVKDYIRVIKYEVKHDDWGELIQNDVDLDFLRANDDNRGDWFIKLNPEFIAYEEMIKAYGFTISTMRHFITEGLALNIRAIEFGTGGMFISNDNSSRKDFMTLMTNQLLSFKELKSLKIKLGCSTEEGAYIISELNKNNLLTLSYDDIGKYQCFYSKYDTPVILTNGGLRAALSKFKKEDSSATKKSNYKKGNRNPEETNARKKDKFNTMTEIDDCIKRIYKYHNKE